MSRCFPYPPPGYSVNIDRSQALIESIKLQKERENAKAERKKEKNREKKEKHKEKNKKPKHDRNAISNDDEKANTGRKGQIPSKWHDVIRKEDKAEQLERSGLTEEHGQPTWLLNPSNSSDSTQNSNKRKRDASPPNGCSTRGNTIRIRLPLQKHKEDMSVSRGGVCSTSGRTELRLKEPHCSTGGERLSLSSGKTESYANYTIGVAAGAREDLPTSVRADFVAGELPSRLGKEPSSMFGKTEIRLAGNDSIQTSTATTSVEKKLKKVESRYKDLIENWVPPALTTQLSDFDDQEDWLFGEKHQCSSVENRFKEATAVVSCCPSTLRPSAQYLPEHDIYALPYTVPY